MHHPAVEREERKRKTTDLERAHPLVHLLLVRGRQVVGLATVRVRDGKGGQRHALPLALHAIRLPVPQRLHAAALQDELAARNGILFVQVVGQELVLSSN